MLQSIADAIVVQQTPEPGPAAPSGLQTAPTSSSVPTNILGNNFIFVGQNNGASPVAVSATNSLNFSVGGNLGNTNVPNPPPGARGGAPSSDVGKLVGDALGGVVGGSSQQSSKVDANINNGGGNGNAAQKSSPKLLSFDGVDGDDAPDIKFVVSRRTMGGDGNEESEASEVTEPATLALIATALILLAGLRRREGARALS
jgi:hypothetical protein